MSKEFKIPQYTPLQLNSNIAYGLTKENNISKDELDSVQWLCEAYEHQIKQISDLEQKLALTEKALELACSRIKSIYCSDYCGRLCDDWAMSEEDIKNECKIYYKCWNKDCILEQAKEMIDET